MAPALALAATLAVVVVFGGHVRGPEQATAGSTAAVAVVAERQARKKRATPVDRDLAPHEARAPMSAVSPSLLDISDTPLARDVVRHAPDCEPHLLFKEGREDALPAGEDGGCVNGFADDPRFDCPVQYCAAQCSATPDCDFFWVDDQRNNPFAKAGSSCCMKSGAGTTSRDPSGDPTGPRTGFYACPKKASGGRMATLWGFKVPFTSETTVVVSDGDTHHLLEGPGDFEAGVHFPDDAATQITVVGGEATLYTDCPHDAISTSNDRSMECKAMGARGASIKRGHGDYSGERMGLPNKTLSWVRIEPAMHIWSNPYSEERDFQNEWWLMQGHKQRESYCKEWLTVFDNCHLEYVKARCQCHDKTHWVNPEVGGQPLHCLEHNLRDDDGRSRNDNEYSELSADYYDVTAAECKHRCVKYNSQADNNLCHAITWYSHDNERLAQNGDPMGKCLLSLNLCTHVPSEGAVGMRSHVFLLANPELPHLPEKGVLWQGAWSASLHHKCDEGEPFDCGRDADWTCLARCQHACTMTDDCGGVNWNLHRPCTEDPYDPEGSLRCTQGEATCEFVHEDCEVRSTVLETAGTGMDVIYWAQHMGFSGNHWDKGEDGQCLAPARHYVTRLNTYRHFAPHAGAQPHDMLPPSLKECQKECVALQGCVGITFYDALDTVDGRSMCVPAMGRCVRHPSPAGGRRYMLIRAGDFHVTQSLSNVLTPDNRLHGDASGAAWLDYPSEVPELSPDPQSAGEPQELSMHAVMAAEKSMELGEAEGGRQSRRADELQLLWVADRAAGESGTELLSLGDVLPQGQHFDRDNFDIALPAAVFDPAQLWLVPKPEHAFGVYRVHLFLPGVPTSLSIRWMLNVGVVGLHEAGSKLGGMSVHYAPEAELAGAAMYTNFEDLYVSHGVSLLYSDFVGTSCPACSAAVERDTSARVHGVKVGRSVISLPSDLSPQLVNVRTTQMYVSEQAIQINRLNDEAVLQAWHAPRDATLAFDGQGRGRPVPLRSNKLKHAVMPNYALTDMTPGKDWVLTFAARSLPREATGQHDAFAAHTVMVDGLTITAKRDLTEMQCRPGHFLDKDTKCKPCPLGHFTPTFGVNLKCFPLTICPPGTRIARDASGRPLEGSATEDRVCVGCEAGKYAESVNAERCYSKRGCITGQYVSAFWGTLREDECAQCEAGRFRQGTTWTADKCPPSDHCPAGWFAVAATPTSGRDCRECPVGMFSEGVDWSSCHAHHDCPKGTHVVTEPTATRQRECEPCEQGKFSAEKNAAECTKVDFCAAGTYTKLPLDPREADVECVACPPAHFSAFAQSLQCVPWSRCAPGTGVVLAGTASSDRVCDQCAEGKFTQSFGADPCQSWQNCAQGGGLYREGTRYSDRVCTACAPGTFSQSNDGNQCQPWSDCGLMAVLVEGTTSSDVQCQYNKCGAGEFLDTARRPAECRPWRTCPPGMGMSEPGSSLSDRSCAVCSAGTFSSSADAVPCRSYSLCPPGKAPSATEELSILSDRTCVGCAAGRFSSTSDAGLCKAWRSCPPGHGAAVSGTDHSDIRCRQCNGRVGGVTAELVKSDDDEYEKVVILDEIEHDLLDPELGEVEHYLCEAFRCSECVASPDAEWYECGWSSLDVGGGVMRDVWARYHKGGKWELEVCFSATEPEGSEACDTASGMEKFEFYSHCLELNPSGRPELCVPGAETASESWPRVLATAEECAAGGLVPTELEGALSCRPCMAGDDNHILASNNKQRYPQCVDSLRDMLHECFDTGHMGCADSKGCRDQAKQDAWCDYVLASGQCNHLHPWSWPTSSCRETCRVCKDSEPVPVTEPPVNDDPCPRGQCRSIKTQGCFPVDNVWYFMGEDEIHCELMFAEGGGMTKIDTSQCPEGQCMERETRLCQELDDVWYFLANDGLSCDLGTSSEEFASVATAAGIGGVMRCSDWVFGCCPASSPGAKHVRKVDAIGSNCGDPCFDTGEGGCEGGKCDSLKAVTDWCAGVVSRHSCQPGHPSHWPSRACMKSCGFCAAGATHLMATREPCKSDVAVVEWPYNKHQDYALVRVLDRWLEPIGSFAHLTVVGAGNIAFVESLDPSEVYRFQVKQKFVSLTANWTDEQSWMPYTAELGCSAAATASSASQLVADQEAPAKAAVELTLELRDLADASDDVATAGRSAAGGEYSAELETGGGDELETEGDSVETVCDETCADSGESACGGLGCHSAAQIPLWCDAVKALHLCNKEYSFTWPTRACTRTCETCLPCEGSPAVAPIADSERLHPSVPEGFEEEHWCQPGSCVRAVIGDLTKVWSAPASQFLECFDKLTMETHPVASWGHIKDDAERREQLEAAGFTQEPCGTEQASLAHVQVDDADNYIDELEMEGQLEFNEIYEPGLLHDSQNPRWTIDEELGTQITPRSAMFLEINDQPTPCVDPIQGTYTMQTDAEALCAVGGKKIDVTYYDPIPCGANGELKWDRMYAEPSQVPEDMAGLCRWSVDGVRTFIDQHATGWELHEWVESWVGFCGVPPVDMPDLPMRFCEYSVPEPIDEFEDPDSLDMPAVCQRECASHQNAHGLSDKIRQMRTVAVYDHVDEDPDAPRAGCSSAKAWQPASWAVDMRLDPEFAWSTRKLVLDTASTEYVTLDLGAAAPVAALAGIWRHEDALPAAVRVQYTPTMELPLDPSAEWIDVPSKAGTEIEVQPGDGCHCMLLDGPTVTTRFVRVLLDKPAGQAEVTTIELEVFISIPKLQRQLAGEYINYHDSPVEEYSHAMLNTCEAMTTCVAGTFLKDDGSKFWDRDCQRCPDGSFMAASATPDEQAELDGDADDSDGGVGELGEHKQGFCEHKTLCEPGYHTLFADSVVRDNECEKCPEGRFSVLHGTPHFGCMAWRDCEPGSYVLSHGTPRSDRLCGPCEAGKFSDEQNAAECHDFTPCDQGDGVDTMPDAAHDQGCGGCAEFELTVEHNVGDFTVTDCKLLLDDDDDGLWSRPSTGGFDEAAQDWDPCPLDAQNDIDGDGLCAGRDACPYDAENDVDRDGVCGDVDDVALVLSFDHFVDGEAQAQVVGWTVDGEYCSQDNCLARAAEDVRKCFDAQAEAEVACNREKHLAKWGLQVTSDEPSHVETISCCSFDGGQTCPDPIPGVYPATAKAFCDKDPGCCASCQTDAVWLDAYLEVRLPCEAEVVAFDAECHRKNATLTDFCESTSPADGCSAFGRYPEVEAQELQAEDGVRKGFLSSFAWEAKSGSKGLLSQGRVTSESFLLTHNSIAMNVATASSLGGQPHQSFIRLTTPSGEYTVYGADPQGVGEEADLNGTLATAKVAGAEGPSWQHVVLDVSAHAGERVTVEVVDSDPDGGIAVDGFALFDDHSGCLPECMKIVEDDCSHLTKATSASATNGQASDEWLWAVTRQELDSQVTQREWVEEEIIRQTPPSVREIEQKYRAMKKLPLPQKCFYFEDAEVPYTFTNRLSPTSALFCLTGSEPGDYGVEIGPGFLGTEIRDDKFALGHLPRCVVIHDTDAVGGKVLGVQGSKARFAFTPTDAAADMKANTGESVFCMAEPASQGPRCAAYYAPLQAYQERQAVCRPSNDSPTTCHRTCYEAYCPPNSALACGGKVFGNCLACCQAHGDSVDRCFSARGSHRRLTEESWIPGEKWIVPQAVQTVTADKQAQQILTEAECAQRCMDDTGEDDGKPCLAFYFVDEADLSVNVEHLKQDFVKELETFKILAFAKDGEGDDMGARWWVGILGCNPGIDLACQEELQAFWDRLDANGNGNGKVDTFEFFGPDSPVMADSSEMAIDANGDGDVAGRELVRFLKRSTFLGEWFSKLYPQAAFIDDIGKGQIGMNRHGPAFVGGAHGCVLADECSEDRKGHPSWINRKWHHNKYRPLYTEAPEQVAEQETEESPTYLRRASSYKTAEAALAALRSQPGNLVLAAQRRGLA